MGSNRSFAVFFFGNPQRSSLLLWFFEGVPELWDIPGLEEFDLVIDTKEELIITTQLPNNQWSTSHETIKRNQQVNGGTLWDRNNSFWKMASDSQVWYFTKGPRGTVFSFVAEVLEMECKNSSPSILFEHCQAGETDSHAPKVSAGIGEHHQPHAPRAYVYPLRHTTRK